MGLLCWLFGHRLPSGYSGSPPYLKIRKWSPIDGIGRIHLGFEAECSRCHQDFEVGNFHLHHLKDILFTGINDKARLQIVSESLGINAKADKQLIEDWAADHSHLQKLCIEAGVPFKKAYGDSYGIPSIQDLSDELASRYTLAKAALEKYLEWQAAVSASDDSQQSFMNRIHLLGEARSLAQSLLTKPEPQTND